MGAMLNLALWIFILLLGLSFFGISIEAIIHSPAGEANFGYLLYLLDQIWDVVVSYIQNLNP